MKYSNLARCAALGATVLFAACSGTSNVASTPTHPPFGDLPPQQVVIANTSDAWIFPQVHADDCWHIDPPFPNVAKRTDSQPVKIANECDESDMTVEYFGDENHECTLKVHFKYDGKVSVYTYDLEPGLGTKCTAETTANGELFTYAVK
jgi:hypothetical protein